MIDAIFDILEVLKEIHIENKVQLTVIYKELQTLRQEVEELRKNGKT